jgi:L-seryl-tRNA(Ser) seleniumtransferase
VAATLGLYRSGRALAEIPVWRMIATPMTAIRARAEALVAAISDPRASAVDLEATVGGGALPGEVLASAGVALASRGVDRLLAALRMGEPAVAARIGDGRVLLDLRTVDPVDDDRLAAALRAVLAGAVR